MAPRVVQAFDATSALQMTDSFYFGKIKLPSTQVFAVSRYSFAFVNIKPFMPGHSLVSPSRIVKVCLTWIPRVCVVSKPMICIAICRYFINLHPEVQGYDC